MDPSTNHATSPQIRSTSHSNGPLDLYYEKIEPLERNPSIGPLVLCHGIFGSTIHWKPFTQGFASRLGCPVYALDLRNHGLSPRAPSMTYIDMADDVIHFCKTHNLSNISLLGDSIGGKVVMSVTLSKNLPKNLILCLIVVDIAPAKGHVHAQIAYGQVESHEEADKILAEVEPNPWARNHVFRSITVDPDTGFLGFTFDVELLNLKDSADGMNGFPYDIQGDHRWDGRALVIKGKKSNNLNQHNLPIMQHFFPNFEMREIDNVGHFITVEKPHELIDLVVDFIQKY